MGKRMSGVKPLLSRSTNNPSPVRARMGGGEVRDFLLGRKKEGKAERILGERKASRGFRSWRKKKNPYLRATCKVQKSVPLERIKN